MFIGKRSDWHVVDALPESCFVIDWEKCPLAFGIMSSYLNLS